MKVIGKEYVAKEKVAEGEMFEPTGEILEKGFNAEWGGHRFTDEEIEKLVDMSLMLFDNELLEKNPKNEYLANLKAVIDEYAATEKTITDYTVQSSNMIDKYAVDGVDYAKVRVMYNMRDFKMLEDKDTGFLSGCGTGARKNKEYRYYTTYEDFLLRKDENGKWKILVWQVPEMEGMDGGDE